MKETKTLTIPDDVNPQPKCNIDNEPNHDSHLHTFSVKMIRVLAASSLWRTGGFTYENTTLP